MSGRYPPRSRRSLLRGMAGLGLGVAAWPLIAGCDRSSHQQQPAPVHRVGWLSNWTAEANAWAITQFRKGLAEHGWVEGQNLALEFRFSDYDTGRDGPNATALVGSGMDLLVANGPSGIFANGEAVSTIPIPIVAVQSMVDPVPGVVDSFSRPGGNVTGITAPPIEVFTGKQLEVLKDAVPSLNRAGILWDASGLGSFRPAGAGAPSAQRARAAEIYVGRFEDAARALGIQLTPIEVHHAGELDNAFAAARAAGVEGVVTHPIGIAQLHAPQILDLAARHRLPLASFLPLPGALVIYTVDNPALWRDAAGYVDRILRGARPAEMPIKRPDKYSLIINLKVAAALGLTIPPAVLARATEVIQ
jgi:putative ABC transport system substrate-binding protein